MILVDTSVWIDFVRGAAIWQVDYLTERLATDEVLIGDLVLLELLQRCRTNREFATARTLAADLRQVEIGGHGIVIEAAQHYRALRATGVTIRSTIDCLIAMRCIADGFTLLHRDRDFEPFVAAFGLRVVCPPLH